MDPLEKVKLHKALLVDEHTKEGGTWVPFPYNRDVTPEEIADARAIKLAFVRKCVGDVEVIG